MSDKKILLVEDEPHISQGLKFNLIKEGYQVTLAENGVDALELWETNQPDLIVLDLMLPKLDGYSVLSCIRKADQKLPILILSAKDRIEDKVKGYELGVDDYLAKPFELGEFLMKVKSLLKRSEWIPKEGSQKNPLIKIGDYEIDLEKYTAQFESTVIQLTEQEVKLIDTFFQNQGEVLNRDRLLQESWGYSEQTKSRTVDNFVVRLRKYFEEDPKNPKHFLSMRGRGYLFRP